MKKQFTYTNENTTEISFPLGGIGTGSIGLGGNGRLIDWEIFNRPAKGVLNGFSHFAVKAVKDGEVIGCKVINGDLNKDLTGQYEKSCFRGFGHGPAMGTMCGFPHFANCTFEGKFPIASLVFSDPDFPGEIHMTAFNPLIPHNADDSGIPAAFFEISVENTTDSEIEYTVALSLTNHFIDGAKNRYEETENGSMIHLEQSALDELSTDYGEMIIACDSGNISYQEYWYRGLTFDCTRAYWHDFCSPEKLKNRFYENEPGDFDTATLAKTMTVPAQKKSDARFLIAWYFPNQYNYWNPCKKKTEQGEQDVIWKNYYAVCFKSASDVVQYSMRDWDRLFEKTLQFTDALFSSTLPTDVIDAVSANLSILKSPTVLRLENGDFYAWEGVQEREGSCEGSCSHVWNYAYALPFLFPELERSMRDLEFQYNQDKYGRTGFRLPLPLGRKVDFFPCLDGQMGAVIKVYRDWKLSGNDEWLRSVWKNVKLAIEYAWNKNNDFRWDLNHDGVLEGRQHHTLDTELFGPSGWLQSMYLAALKAGSEMASYLGENETADEYRAVFESGKAWTQKNLFNGEYFEQQIDLADDSVFEFFPDTKAFYWDSENGQIKYQLGTGCNIDQLLGQWHADLCGLGDIYDPEYIMAAQQSILRYNFKPTMRNYCNPCRNYGINGESGTVICEYPEERGAPVFPSLYAQECWSGCEYQFAAHLILRGRVEDGLKLVSAVRNRYDGKKRNPWNEIECGSNYARSMASFSLLPALSGFSFNLPREEIGFFPAVSCRPFSCFWSIATCWGVFITDDEKTSIIIKDGCLLVKRLLLSFLEDGKWSVTIDGTVSDMELVNGVLTLPEGVIASDIISLK